MVNSYYLQRSNQNLERFAYVASHDLQEPLRKIQSFSDILQSTYGSQLGEGVDLLERIQQAGGRMSVLIKDLLMFSRIQTQRDSFAPVELRAVVEGVLTDLELAVGESGAVVDMAELPADVKPTRTADCYYRITVTDNGIGFDEKYVDRIFEVFQRLHGRSQYSGTGIGLAIVQKVVDNHGGAITVRSRPDEGARFMVYLPA